jgi:hypothetical protein
MPAELVERLAPHYWNHVGRAQNKNSPFVMV